MTWREQASEALKKALQVYLDINDPILPPRYKNAYLLDGNITSVLSHNQLVAEVVHTSETSAVVCIPVRHISDFYPQQESYTHDRVQQLSPVNGSYILSVEDLPTDNPPLQRSKQLKLLKPKYVHHR
jgi:hypothetical protein